MIDVKVISDVKYEDYDVVYAIVRSMKYKSNKIIQVPELSPSKELFFEYLKLKKAKNWNKETFEKIYVPQFLKEMKEKKATDWLNKIYIEGKQKRICLVCFCPQEELCHRTIVQGLLQGVKANISLEKDYRKYYEMYVK